MNQSCWGAVMTPSTNDLTLTPSYWNNPDCASSLKKTWYLFYPAGFQTPLTCAGPSEGWRCVWRCVWIIFWGCCSVPEEIPERRWGWRSAGSWLSGPRPPSSSGSLPLSAAASPAEKTSRSLCQAAPPCGYCSVLQNTIDKDSSTENVLNYRQDTF